MKPAKILLTLATTTLFATSATATTPILEELIDQAKNGDTSAQIRLGDAYIAQNNDNGLARGLLWLHKAAQKNSTEALYKLGNFYREGKIVQRNDFQAYSYYKNAAANNHLDPIYHMSVYLSRGISSSSTNNTPAVAKDEKKSIALLNTLIEKGHAPALKETARLYLSQPILKPDDAEKAYNLLLKAVNKNNSDAMVLLADCLYKGVGCKPDQTKMIYYLKKASQLNNNRAQARLAYCYENGIGVQPDNSAAFRLYNLSAENGSSASLVRMANYYITGDFVKHDLTKALQLYKAAATINNPNALYKLGIFSLQGIGTKRDDKKAASYFQQAAEQGFAKAQHSLADMYAKGRGITKDEEHAFKWYFEAAKQNNNASQLELALCYKNGKGTKQSPKEYKRWLKVAAGNGNREAATLLQPTP